MVINQPQHINIKAFTKKSRLEDIPHPNAKAGNIIG